MNALTLRLLSIADRCLRDRPGLYWICYRSYKALADRKERRLILRYLRPGMTAIDVGANVGAYAEFLAKTVGPNGRVVAFEPAPSNVRLLRRVVSRSGVVEVVEAAVGDRDGEAVLYLSEAMGVDHRIYDTGEGWERQRVRLVSLDSYVGDRPVDFVKIDIQGAEMYALRGMQGLLARNPRMCILMEFWPYALRKAGSSPQELISFLSQRGFHISTLEGLSIDAGSNACLRTEPTFYMNLMARRDIPSA